MILIIILATYACRNKSKPVYEEPFDPAKYEEPLINANKYLVKTEDERIREYISRYKWNMESTGTGLRYMIYHNGYGEIVEPGSIVRYNYEISLLTGELCYSSEKEGPATFRVGKGFEVDGLQEGILLLRVGDKAKFIIPSHLAFGLLGDENKIGQKAALVYDIEVLDNIK